MKPCRRRLRRAPLMADRDLANQNAEVKSMSACQRMVHDHAYDVGNSMLGAVNMGQGLALTVVIHALREEVLLLNLHLRSQHLQPDQASPCTHPSKMHPVLPSCAVREELSSHL